MLRWLFVGLLLGVPVAGFSGEIRGTVQFAGPAEDPKPPIAVYLETEKPLPPPEEKPRLSQKDAQFSPRLLVVSAGQTVVMPNDDAIAHNVFSYSKIKQFNLGIYPQGESREVTFEKPGRVDIYCSIHRHMHGVILVVPTPYFTVGELEKEFALKDVPEGEYTVVVWMDGAKEARIPLKLTSDASELVEVRLEPAEPKKPE